MKQRSPEETPSTRIQFLEAIELAKKGCCIVESLCHIQASMWIEEGYRPFLTVDKERSINTQLFLDRLELEASYAGFEHVFVKGDSFVTLYLKPKI